MTNRLSLAVAMFAAAAALLVAAGLAHSAGEAGKGGTLRMSAPGDVDSLDPALAYAPRSWMLSYATCAKLFNYPDAAGTAGTRVVEEVVDRTTVSGDGRTYTFDLKKTFRFHTGAPVTAQSFAAAFNRDANPKLESPAVLYMREIVGAAAVIDGKADSISGVRVLSRPRRPTGKSSTTHPGQAPTTSTSESPTSASFSGGTRPTAATAPPMSTRWS